jgi:hypothetical protein
LTSKLPGAVASIQFALKIRRCVMGRDSLDLNGLNLTSFMASSAA